MLDRFKGFLKFVKLYSKTSQYLRIKTEHFTARADTMVYNRLLFTILNLTQKPDIYSCCWSKPLGSVFSRLCLRQCTANHAQEGWLEKGAELINIDDMDGIYPPGPAA